MRWLALIPASVFLVAWWGYVDALPYDQLPYDDSYIAQQYARFILPTGKLTFDGIHSSYGATSPPHVFLLAVTRQIIADPVWAARTLGLILHVVFLICLYRLISDLGCRRVVSVVVASVAAVCGFLVVDSLNGLETSLFHALSVAFLWGALRIRERQRIPLLVLLGWALSWCRPEGILFVLAGTPYLLHNAPNMGFPGRRRWFLAGLLLLAPLVVLIDQLRPGEISSWQLKMEFYDEVSWPIEEKIAIAGKAIMAFLYYLRWFLIIPVVALAIRIVAWLPGRFKCGAGGCLAENAVNKRMDGWVVSWGVTYVGLFYVAYAWCLPSSLGYLDFRYQHVLLPWFFIATAWGIEFLLSSIRQDSSRRIALGLLFIPLLMGSAMTYVGSRMVYLNCVRSVGNVLVPLAERIDAMAVPGDTVAAHDVGVLGYHTRLPVRDLVGLTDPRAPERLHNEFDYREFVLDSGQGYLVIHPSWDDLYFHIRPEKPDGSFEFLFRSDPAFGDRYHVYRFGG